MASDEPSDGGDAKAKTTSLKAFHDQVVQEREQLERGMYDEDVRTIPRWQAQQMLGSARLRPGAQKQALRDDEEEALELQRMGSGVVLKPRDVLGNLLPGQRTAAYGIFARPDRVEQTMRPAWAGRDPEVVLADPAFYDDVLRRCHQVELTLMLLTSRPLPLAQVRPAVAGALQQGMQRLAGAEALGPQDKDDLQQFVRLFDDSRLAQCGWVERGHVKKGTHFIFTTTTAGGVTAEAVTPGPLRDRKTSFIGKAGNPLITGAIFNAFVGPRPLDAVGKQAVGAGVLWAANGLAFKPGRHPDAALGWVDKEGEVRFAAPADVQLLPASTSIFRVLEDGLEPVRMLVSGIAGRRAGRAAALVEQP